MLRVLIHQGSLLLVCFFPSPLQVIERILVSVRRKRLWDTGPGQGAGERDRGQGEHLHPTGLTVVIQERREVPFPKRAAWRGRSSVRKDEYYNPGNETRRRGDRQRSGLPHARSRHLTWTAGPTAPEAGDILSRSRELQMGLYILPPALRSPVFYPIVHCILMLWVFSFIFPFPSHPLMIRKQVEFGAS